MIIFWAWRLSAVGTDEFWAALMLESDAAAAANKLLLRELEEESCEVLFAAAAFIT